MVVVAAAAIAVAAVAVAAGKETHYRSRCSPFQRYFPRHQRGPHRCKAKLVSEKHWEEEALVH